MTSIPPAPPSPSLPSDPATDTCQRFARQLALPEVGVAGQGRLAEARVLIVGLGGLGSPAAFYLAAAGVGTLGLMDADVVDLSNLQRQILHTTADVGRPKVQSAADRLRALHPQTRLLLYPERLTADNAATVLHGFSIVIDATDSVAAKFLIADACHALRRPYVHGGVERFYGQAMTVIPGTTACYRCVFRTPPPGPDAGPPQGPLGVVPGVIGIIQAAEAIKHVLGIGQPLTNRLLTFDALAMTARCVPVRRSPDCPLCGIHTSP